MKKDTIISILILAFITLFFASCEETGEWYLGFHKQPKFFDEDEYSKTINVFGIIRPDDVDGEQQSFIRVERTTSSKDIGFSDSITLNEANVVISFNDNEYGKQVLDFNLTQYEDPNTPDVFDNNNLNAKAGQTYYLECSHPGYETVFASTTVPNAPVISSITKADDKLLVQIEADTSAYLYEAVYFSFSSGYTEPGDGQTNISFEFDSGILAGGLLQVFAYDKNLADYFSDVTSSILNLNSYRAPYTSVDGGYGCFGSLNFTSVIVE